MKKRFLPLAFSCAAAALILVGCGDKAKTFTLVIECDDAISKRSVEVDLIGVNPSNKDQVLSYPVTAYWDPNDKQRASQSDRVIKNFGPGLPRRYVMNLKDPEVKKIWAKWISRGVTDVIIIANLKTVITDVAGIADPRRKLIPRKSKEIKENYPDAKGFRIFIQDASVSIDPLHEIPKETTK